MKGSLATSTVLHALVLGFALSSFTAPKTLEVADVEAFPVSIVPIEELTQIQQGEKSAPVAEKAAPKPTARPGPVPDAENVGDNTVDLKPAKAAKPSPKEVVSEAPPKPAEKPAPLPEPIPEKPAAEPVKVAEPKPAPPAPAPAKPAEPKPAPKPAPAEVAALPAESAPDPVADTIAEAAPAEPQFTALPSAGPVPQTRPEPQKAAPRPIETASSKKSDFNADEVAALLNKQEAQGGGAKRSSETASLGGARTTRGNTLSQSEMDALRGQIQKYWNIIPGMADGGDVRVTVKMKLDPAGNIVGQPEVSATGGSAGTRGTLANSARRAVLRAQPYQLPSEKYASWSDVIVNFDPSQMF